MNTIKVIPFIILMIVVAACSEEPATPTLIPATQTPIIITATPLPATPTLIPSATFTTTPMPSLTPPTSDSGSADDEQASPAQVARPVNNFKSNCTAKQDWEIYTVKVGDTLGRLATQTNSTLNKLADANCLINPNIIVVGQSLRLPQQPDRGDEPDPVIEDLITSFNVNQPEVTVGKTITFSWKAEAGTVISIVNKTLNNTLIGSDLSDSGLLTYNIPASLDPETIKAITFSVSGKLIRDDGDIFANPLERTVSIVAPDDCDDSGSTDTTDDDCDNTDVCDDSGATGTTDDDCDDTDDDTSDDDDTSSTD